MGRLMGRREDKSIERLDEMVSSLKVEYEKYFMRRIKREPVKLRGDIDRLVLRLTTANPGNTALKFRLNSIVSKYNAFKQYWNRVLKAIEEGTYVRTAEGGSGLMASPVGAPKFTDDADGPKTDEPAALDEPGEIDILYDKYIEARKKCGEPVKGLTRASIEKTVKKHREQLKSRYGEREIEFCVAIKDGKTKLVARPKKK